MPSSSSQRINLRARAASRLLLLGAVLLACGAAKPSADSEAVSSDRCVLGRFAPDLSHCVCYECVVGRLCDSILDDCVLDASANEAFIADEYWELVQAGEPWINVSAGYRTGYVDPVAYHYDEQNKIAKHDLPGQLSLEIRKLHKLVGNCDLTDRSVVITHGATQGVQATIHAFGVVDARKYNVFAQTPFYYLLPSFTELNKYARWNTSYKQDPSSVIEFHVYPNNPTGRRTRPHYPGAAHLLQDLVYYWPSYTNVDEAHAGEHALFSLSKLTGHSGSRIGWAIAKDREVADQMAHYVLADTHGIAVESMWRALAVLRVLNADGGVGGRQFFQHVRTRLQHRWKRFAATLARSDHYTIEGAHDFLLAWVKCHRGAPDACYSQFLAVGIHTIDGVATGAPGFVRVNMMGRDSDFELLMLRMDRLVQLPRAQLEAARPTPACRAMARVHAQHGPQSAIADTMRQLTRDVMSGKMEALL